MSDTNRLFEGLNYVDRIFECNQKYTYGCQSQAIGWFYGVNKIFGCCADHLCGVREAWKRIYPNQQRELTKCAINQLLTAHKDHQERIASIIKNDARYIRSDK